MQERWFSGLRKEAIAVKCKEQQSPGQVVAPYAASVIASAMASSATFQYVGTPGYRAVGGRAEGHFSNVPDLVSIRLPFRMGSTTILSLVLARTAWTQGDRK